MIKASLFVVLCVFVACTGEDHRFDIAYAPLGAACVGDSDCVPGFEWEDFQMENRATLTQLFPQHNIECQGRVIWVERKQYSDIYNVGIEFTQTSSLLDSQREIEELSSRPSINNL